MSGDQNHIPERHLYKVPLIQQGSANIQSYNAEQFNMETPVQTYMLHSLIKVFYCITFL